MKKKEILLCIALIFSVFSYSQSSTPVTTIVKDWTGLAETGTETEVYYSYVKCDEVPKVLLKFYNEVPFNQSIKIKVTVKYLSYVFTEEKVISLAPNETKAGVCGSQDKSLFISLTPMWEFDKATIEAQVLEAKAS